MKELVLLDFKNVKVVLCTIIKLEEKNNTYIWLS
jgi:hypothetical protein